MRIVGNRIAGHLNIGDHNVSLRERGGIGNGLVEILNQVVGLKILQLYRGEGGRLRLTGQTVRGGCFLLQVNTRLGIHAAQLANHQGTRRRSIASLQGLSNSTALGTQTLHGATPQGHAAHQGEHRLEARLAYRSQKTDQ